MSQAQQILEHQPNYETRIVPGFTNDGEAMKWRVLDVANHRIVAEGAVPVEASGASIAWQKAASQAEAAVKLDRMSVKVRSAGRRAVKTNGDEAPCDRRLALEG